MSGRGDPDAKAKAIAETKKEGIIFVVGVVVAVAVAQLGGAAALGLLRWVIAVLALGLLVTARILRRRRRRVDNDPRSTEDQTEEVWRREQARYEATKREL